MTIRSVVCAVSGGVDSAVSAYLLKRRGFQVKGVFMTNWDDQDQGIRCSSNDDRNDAEKICAKLDIPFYELNFVKEYWIYIFQPILRSYELGFTPNPDIMCNRFLKFNFFTRAVLRNNDFPTNSIFTNRNTKLVADAVATGHYCQNSFGNFLENSSSSEPYLLRGFDSVKDQTFWLSTVPSSQLRHFMFPVGGMLKSEVKKLAAAIGLKSTAERRESMGMCFIGKRRFSKFIDNYLSPRAGLFKELGTGVVLDEHCGIHHYTPGQRAPIQRATGPFYIARMDFPSQDIYVVRDPYHPALFMRKCWTAPAVWINSTHPKLPSTDILFQWQNKWRAIGCHIEPHATVEEAAMALHPGCSSVGSELLNTIDASCEEERPLGQCLAIELNEPMRCIAAGQWAALYLGNQCLGGALICGSVSLWDEGCDVPYKNWDIANYELSHVC